MLRFFHMRKRLRSLARPVPPPAGPDPKAALVAAEKAASGAAEAAGKAVAASRRLAAGAFRLVSAAWFLTETALWLAALAALVSAGIWVAYLVGKQAGWSHPALTWAAEKVGFVWREVWERVGIGRF